MYESNLAESAYLTYSSHTGTPRDVEYRLFARVTRQLAATHEGATDQISKQAKAIYDNERLWRTLAADVAENGNGLPKELRSKILYLYEFTRLHSRRVMRGEATPEVLVEINTAIMRGLKYVPEDQEAAS